MPLIIVRGGPKRGDLAGRDGPRSGGGNSERTPRCESKPERGKGPEGPEGPGKIGEAGAEKKDGGNDPSEGHQGRRAQRTENEMGQAGRRMGGEPAKPRAGEPEDR